MSASRFLMAVLVAAMAAGCGSSLRPLPEVGGVVEKARAGDDDSLALLVRYVTSPVEGEPLTALTALIEAGERSVPHLVKALEDPDPAVAEWAAGALGNIRDRRAFEPLLKALERRDFPAYVGVWALGELGDPAAIPVLVRRLGDPNPGVRRYATRSLVKFGPAAVPAAVDALGSPDPTVRRYAARVLGQSNDPRAAAPLLERYGDLDPEVALWALGRLRARDALAVVVRETAAADWRVRLAAVQALGALEDERAVPTLRKTIEDPEWVVREWSARALEDITQERQLYRDQHGEMVVPYNLYH